jgi:CDP-diacylglycerol pyrophosphatase
MRLMQRRAALLGGAILLALMFAVPASCANRDALRQIVQEQCLIHWRDQHSPAPCEEVDLPSPEHPDSGYAVLADRKGGAHFLLIPTGNISGIESPALTAPDALNYFQAAWHAHDRLAAVVGHEVPRNAVGLAVNPLHARSQDQLHIHIECLRPDVFDTLNRVSARISTAWTPLTLGGARYQARKIADRDLKGDNPFKDLASRMPEPDRTMGDYTLVLAGAEPPGGPAFIMLASSSAAGELLLDSSCAAASSAH